VQERKIDDQNPYIAVRWRPEDGRTQLRRSALFIPSRFEAGIVASSLHVVLQLEATAVLNDIFELAGQEPLVVEDEVLVKQVEVRTDRFSLIDAADFKRIPLKKWTRMAVAAAAGTRGELMSATGDGGTAEEWREKRVSFSELGPRSVGRPRLEAGFMYRGRWIELEEVLEVASDGAPRHMKAVQEHFGSPDHPVPRETARRWVRRARQRATQAPDETDRSTRATT
jgi:hypothetical protein